MGGNKLPAIINVLVEAKVLQPQLFQKLNRKIL